MYKPCLPLLAVLMTSTGQWVPGYTGHYTGYTGHYTLSPSLYQPRTALDVLQPSIGYTYSYPWAHNTLPLGAVYYPTVVPSSVKVVTAEATEEEEESVPVVTIQHTIDSLPLPPNSLGSNSKFRNPIPPAIPAGIVQATHQLLDKLQSVSRMRVG